MRRRPDLKAPVNPSGKARWTMLDTVRNMTKRYLVYIPLLIGVCIGIFPFVILYTLSLGIGQLLDAIFPHKRYGQKLDHMWDVLGKPYDYLVSKL